MPMRVLQVEVNGHQIEVACYGSGKDWLCRLTDSSSQLPRHNDAYAPPPDLGFVWLRESDHKWLASSLVNKDVFSNLDDVDAVLHRVMTEIVGDDSQLARCIEFVAAELTVTVDGEQGVIEGPGGWAESRWWQP